ncbi:MULTISPECIES: NUDIX hydrolase [Sutcliffiella]|uniref:ADP-ribose pyrophosphatase n=1 Tax=Sutcliffiella cohnii TaxID=33932 RepID=A0A223KPF9_9BACI|nr:MULTISPECIES: NUDIX hydrolase [Sutcliffiella]AST91213.1 ADP-ribose pyrophosphatase [Sutcliffiella cohnii]MED4018817.1 NUDIX hydrolase [Sutcliffiella cohnii]WBL17028.1 NUDIX hydrolase [Sutcliffiella sp. NC1]
MDKWKTLKSEYINKSPFGNIRKDSCELPNGIVIDEYYVNEYSDWVNAVVITKENQILLVEQYRYAGEDFFLEVPAGKKEGNETDEEGLIREVREETGYISDTKPIFLGEFMVNPATQNNKIKTFLLLDAYKKHEQDLDDTEEIDVKLYDFDCFGELITTNKIKTQLFTVTAYFMAKNYLVENNHYK